MYIHYQYIDLGLLVEGRSFRFPYGPQFKPDPDIDIYSDSDSDSHDSGTDSYASVHSDLDEDGDLDEVLPPGNERADELGRNQIN